MVFFEENKSYKLYWTWLEIYISQYGHNSDRGVKFKGRKLFLANIDFSFSELNT